MRLNYTSRLMAALASILSQTAANPMRELASQTNRRTANRSHRPRSNYWYRRSGSVKTSWPGQTEAQRDEMLTKAEGKRERKARKLERDTIHSFGSNYAHWSTRDRRMGNMPKRFDPFHVAH